MSKDREQAPFIDLGGKLKKLRQSQKESLAEAAGAVELAEEELLRIEQGVERPSEEILVLLIRHFKIVEDEALRLWELAGYDDEDDTDGSQQNHGLPKSIVMTIAMDPRIMYSDNIVINGNKNGVVLTFLQSSGSSTIPAFPVSRIGMSREQAKSMLSILRDTIECLDNYDAPGDASESSDGGERKKLPPEAS